MRWFLLIVLVFGCFGFSQSLAEEYTADEIFQYFSNNFEVQKILYNMLHQENRNRFPDGSWKLTEKQKILQYISFDMPIRVYRSVRPESILDNNNVRQLSVYALVQQKHRESEDMLSRLENYSQDEQLIEFLANKTPEERLNFLEQTKQAAIEHYQNGDTGKLYDLENNNLDSKLSELFQGYYLVPVYYKKYHQGYLKILALKDKSLDSYLSTGYLSAFIKQPSVYPYHPFRVDVEKAQNLTSFIEEPILVDFTHSHVRRQYNTVDLKNFSKNDERLYWVFDKGSKVVSLKTGRQYEIRNLDQEVVGFSELSPTIRYYPDDTNVYFVLDGEIKPITANLYSKPPLYIRIQNNRRDIASTIRTIVSTLLIALGLLMAKKSIKVQQPL